MEKIFKKILAVGFVSMLFFSVIAPFTAAAQSSADRCSKFAQMFNINLNDKSGGSLITGAPQFCSIGQLMAWFTNLLLMFAGGVAVVFIIIGGFNLLTSGGNEEQAEKGKKILVNSIIGLVIIIMAGAIVRIVINTLNSDFTNTGGSNATTNTGSNGTGGGNGSGGNTQINSEYGKFLGSLPSSARVGDTVSVTFLAQLGASEMTALRNNLNAQCGSNPTLSLEISGQAAVQDTMSVNPTSLASTVSTKVTGSTGNRNLTVKLCGMTIGTQSITIQDENSTPVSSGAGSSVCGGNYASKDACVAETGDSAYCSSICGNITTNPTASKARYSDADALGAAARSGFTVDMINDEMVIKISASPDDVKYMCDAEGTVDQFISVYNGSTGESEKFAKTVREVKIAMQEGDPIPTNVGVKICGYELNRR